MSTAVSVACIKLTKAAAARTKSRNAGHVVRTGVVSSANYATDRPNRRPKTVLSDRMSLD